MLPPVPRCSDWASSSLISPSRISLPRSCSRVGLHIDLFGACSAFTRVAARTLAPSPICDQLHRRLQPFRHLHDCSGCFRLERSPGGTFTHWKAPPCHGAHVKGTLGPRRWTGQARESDLELDSSLSWTVMASPTSSRRSNCPTRRRAVFPGLFCLVRRSCRARYPRQPRPHPSLETGGPR